ncbi:hypothetical protein N7456_004776 [Penicillium angulare]|uniref:Rrn9 domain-containing protein n=1 Tax=Penicillium angulare TaxID=116970 RepID=A0A9W9FX25_9EURO|nr:hypothetical protein N7456_004776 [Penicillium angulare]
MSSFSDNLLPSSSQYLPPRSAQVRGSLFGGPSSDADPPPSSLPEPARRSIFGGFSSQDVDQEPEKQLEPIKEGSEQEEDEFDMILRERPLEAYYGSDGDSFRGSSDEDSKKSKKASKKPENSEAKIRPPAEVALPQPTYVVHRGVDLPPGVERPNRWRGWPHYYRQVIANEVGVLDSLMTTRARDLAGHLYDSFASRQQRNQDQGKFGNAEDSNDEENTAFPKMWISWPMAADAVPRADEPIRGRLDRFDGLDNYRLQPDMRPSAELEEWIMAAMMKTAKERFLAREWDDDIEVTKKEESPDPDTMAVGGHEEYEDSTWKLPDRLFREPVVQTDDDLSRSQLRPLSRTVISQLDQILMGLHQALKHRANHHYSSDESATETEDEESVPPAKGKGRKQDESRGRKRNREPKTFENSSPDRVTNSRSSSATGIEADDTLEHPQLTEDASGRVPLALSERLPLRDWSEVMGIAAIMGLPSNAVQRASKRCADIFEQDMTFRKFREGRMVKIKKHRSPSGQNPHQLVYAESESESESGIVQQPQRMRGTGKYLKPVAGNVPEGTSRDTESVSRHSSKAREEIKVKRSRSPSTVGSTPIDAAQLYGKDPNRESLFFCPIEGCRRSNNGFNRLWNFKLHMRRIHPQQYEQTFSNFRAKQLPSTS